MAKERKNKMKTTNKALVTLLVLGASAWMATAQDGGNPPQGERPPRREGPGGPGGEGRRPVPPLMNALDANHDGTIDETEIANASTALKKLDKNGDGKITPDEIRPVRPEGGPGGQGGQGGQPGNRPQPPQGNN